MPITQSRVIAIVEIADRALRCFRGLRQALREDAAAGIPADAIVARMIDRINASPDVAEDCAVISAELEHFRHTEHKNNRNAARKRRQRGKGDGQYVPTVRSRPSEQRHAAAPTPIIPHLEPGDYIVRDDGAIISELPATKPPVSQAELDTMIANAARMLAQPVQHGPEYIPDLLKRIPKAPSTLAAEEAARQALENGGGED